MKITMNALKIHPQDNVATVIEPIQSGISVSYAESGNMKAITAKESISVYHKIAISDIPSGTPVIKYGEVIGIATKPICAGMLVHVHNVISAPNEIPTTQKTI